MTGLRVAVPGDAAAIARIYAPYVLDGPVSFETEAPDAATMAQRMAASGGAFPWLVATDGDADDAAILGFAYAGRFRDRGAYDWVTETTIYLDSGARGRGVGRRLYTVLLDTLARQGYVQAIGAISLPNAPSVALHEALGFRPAGRFPAVGHKQGRWIDVGYWQRPLAMPGDHPAPPRPFSAVGLPVR